MKPIPTLSLSLMVLMSWLPVKDPDWRQLVPLRSTRANVERLMGPSKGDYFANYTLEEGELFIEYSSGPCRPDRKGGWNIPKDVVISLSFTPNEKKRISSLKLSPKKFRRVVDEHVGGVVYYINDEEGITYEVQRGRVDVVYYEPSRIYDHLYCGDPLDEKKTPGNKIKE